MVEISEDIVRQTVRLECEAAGSIAKWAKAHGIRPQQVDAFLRKEFRPQPKIYTALGLERVIVYRKKP